ncbi:MAG: hypothetical protein ABIC19_00755 [Patescibacteria group bacterium]|nr:hypothetical protein [Patescibacteria group bacterium]
MEIIYNLREKRLAEIQRYFFIEKIKVVLNIAATTILAIILLDLFIVMMTAIQVAYGIETPNIPFWTKQVEVLVRMGIL